VSDIAPNDVASDTPQTLTDEAILARFLASKNPPGSARTLGFRMLSVSQAERRVEIAFEPSVEAVGNPMGQVQGGFVCAMLDECMSVAGMITSGMTCVVPTLEMKTSFLRPAIPGPLKGVGWVVKLGQDRLLPGRRALRSRRPDCWPRPAPRRSPRPFRSSRSRRP
jgi:uncharacterized protein (TIGR00369 family)